MIASPARAKPKAKPVYGTTEVSRLTGFCPRTICKWFDAGQLKGFVVPGSKQRRITHQSLVKFLGDHGMPLGGLSATLDSVRVLLVGGGESLRQALADIETLEVHIARDPISAAFDAGLLNPWGVVIDLEVLHPDRAELLAQKLKAAYGPVIVSLSGVLPSACDSFLAPSDPALIAARLSGLIARRRREP